jgi:hypothetical protein
MTAELARREPEHGSETVVWSPNFAVSVDAMGERVKAKHDFFTRVMREGDHYGKIPGTGDKAKPALLKPGAELLLASMGLFVQLSDEEPPIRDYGDPDREGTVFYRRVARIYRQTGPEEHDRLLVAQASGSCTSRETKYRYRDAKQKCPECGSEALRKSKKADEPGFYCWQKIGGCGETFRVDDKRITEQVLGRVPNPELADIENTILKMADKRALVAAALLATGCSDIFTQDLEGSETGAPEQTQPPGPEPARAREPVREPVAESKPSPQSGEAAPPRSAARPADTDPPSQRMLDTLLNLYGELARKNAERASFILSDRQYNSISEIRNAGDARAIYAKIKEAIADENSLEGDTLL